MTHKIKYCIIIFKLEHLKVTKQIFKVRQNYVFHVYNLGRFNAILGYLGNYLYSDFSCGLLFNAGEGGGGSNLPTLMEVVSFQFGIDEEQTEYPNIPYAKN